MYQPWRIILDRTLRIPLDAHIVTDDHRDRTIIVHAPIVTHEMEMAMMYLREHDIRLIEIPTTGDAFDWPMLWRSLVTPADGSHGLTSILVEGGAATWDIFTKEGMVDEEVILTGM